MSVTSMKPMLEAMLAGIIISIPSNHSCPIMVPSPQSPKSPNQSCLLQQELKLGPSMHAKGSKFDTYLKKWGMFNPLHSSNWQLGRQKHHQQLCPAQMHQVMAWFHWLWDHSINQKQFCFFLKPGATNLADYRTKHNPASHQPPLSQKIRVSHNISTDFELLLMPSPTTDKYMYLTYCCKGVLELISTIIIWPH